MVSVQGKPTDAGCYRGVKKFGSCQTITQNGESLSMEVPTESTDCLARQRAAYLKDPVPSAESRRADWHYTACSRKTKPRSCRPSMRTLACGQRPKRDCSNCFQCGKELRSAMSHVGKWMRPQKRTVDWLVFTGARNRAIPQPLGVVGVIVLWNFPIQLSF